MDIKQKKNILAHLAQKAGTDQVALQAITKEFAKISLVFQSETQYDRLENQLEILDTIVYVVHQEAVNTIQEFLNRLNSLNLTYQEILGYPVERLVEFRNKNTLMVKALDVLERIRYYHPSEILDIFFHYSCHNEESVAKQAKHGIEKLAAYDLDIFYGDGKNWLGLGWGPQEKALQKIASFNDSQKYKYFSAIIVTCEKVLSPTLSGTNSTFHSVTIRTSAVPALDGIKEIRNKAINELQSLYPIAKNVEQRKIVLNAMESATSTPHMGQYGDDVLVMVIENTVTVLKFMKDIAVSDDLQVMQKIEHDTYWLFYHKGKLDQTIHKLALEIRDAQLANEEYQKFRILIGFESVFHDWERGRKESSDYEGESRLREAEALNLAETIDKDSYDEWKKRIISYAHIKSNDMATFPFFGKFLEHFGKNTPALALQLLSESSDQLETFIIAILSGVIKTDRKWDAYSLIEGWCVEGKYLFSLARLFEFSSELNEELLKKILEKALNYDDLNTLNQIILTVSENYNEENKHLVKILMIPALERLTIHKNSHWVINFWFRKQLINLLSSLDVAEQKSILENLFWLQRIDYQAEEILTAIAKQSPELVVQFFCKRLSKEKNKEDKGKYDAIPFGFHKLSEPLSQHPSLAIDAVLDSYDGNFGLFIYRGARFLKNIFLNFSLEFQQKLLEVVQTKEKKELLFVIAILRNYDGNPIIHNFCKEIVKILPDDSDLFDELCIILQSTGVVSGEYGFVEAYKQKIEDIKPWLQDKDLKVIGFAKNYIADLEKYIEVEEKRVQERIVLRKHQYGEAED